MNSALKPVLSQQQAGGQASPAKANVATANHTVGHPQGAQNSLHHGTNNIVGQNLTHHSSSTPQLPTHSVPSMAPVTPNMAQMAQNMSHHGNLSSLNAAPPIINAVIPNKPTGAPLSLVAEKPVVNASQPLALTRTPEKKEPDSTAQTNGTESPKVQNLPAQAKSPNEPNKDKQDISKTLSSPTKPPEKAVNPPGTPQKKEATVPVASEGPTQPKLATANEPTGNSPAKPCEPKPAPTADVAPTQSNNKPVPESAKASQEKAPSPQKAETAPVAVAEPSKQEPPKVEDKQEEPKTEKSEPKPTEEKESSKPPAVTPDKEAISVEKNKNAESSEQMPKLEKQEEPVTSTEGLKQEEKKVETKTPAAKTEVPKVTPKSALKLATVTTPVRKRRQTSPSKADGAPPAKKADVEKSTPDSRAKRNRTQVQLYQSPTPELTMATKLSASAGRSTPTKQSDDKLIVFYKNEYLAVRNAEGGFYVCQTMQNVYRSTRKIKIRWLSQDKAADPSGQTYKPDFYDTTDMECVLTTLSLQRAPGGGAQLLKPAEQARANSILERAIKAESGDNSVDVTEEHPDGLDLSLYKDESQLEKKGRKRQAKAQPEDSDGDESAEEEVPSKRARLPPKLSPKSAKKAKATPPKTVSPRKQQGSSPLVAPASKTATAVTEKVGKGTPAKKAPAKPAKAATPAKPAKTETPKKPANPAAKKAETPKAETSTPSRARRGAKESKPIPPTPVSVSTRTPRKPPHK